MQTKTDIQSTATAQAVSNGIVLARSAYAVPLTVQAYAAILRGCGITVCGVPEQLELMQCAA
jgi:hypothetical protein